MSPSIDTEVVAVAKRRRFTNADRCRIVLAAAAPGEIGALMASNNNCQNSEPVVKVNVRLKAVPLFAPVIVAW